MPQSEVVARLPAVRVLISGDQRTGWRFSTPGASEPTRAVLMTAEVQFDGGYVLCYSSEGGVYADTWYETLEEAQRIAEEDLGVSREAWAAA